jgi:1,4-alpha-glucan branching enzyme
MNTMNQTIAPGRYPAHNSHRLVNFFCAAPNANTVELAGDFNHWEPFPMQRSLDGWWLASVELTHGHHQYRFMVDGRPVLDPRATGIVRDERGDRASLIAVS